MALTSMDAVSLAPARSLGEARLFHGLDRKGPVTLARHHELHPPLAQLGVAQLIEWCEAVDLRGRGGAGFPVARKLSSLGSSTRPVVVVNGSESEPASRKDRTLLRMVPHLVLDGAQLVADAIGARRIVVAVDDPATLAGVRAAAADRSAGPRIEVRQTTGAFVEGEATALIQAMAGRPGLPPGRKVLPTRRGVDGAPTFLSNVETFAQLAVLGRVGPGGFRSCGTAREPGTTLLTVSGAVARPGVLEIDLGTPLGVVLSAVGASTPRAVVIGGYHGSWLHPRADLSLSRAALEGAGGVLGAGAVIVIDDSTCALGEIARISQWLAAESAGQCGPCRFGLPALAADLLAAVNGQPRGLSGAQRHAQLVTGRGACAHPDGAARFVSSGLALLANDEVVMHARNGGCGRPVRGQLPLGRRPR